MPDSLCMYIFQLLFFIGSKNTNLLLWFLFIVKFIREVTPYIKKPSLVSDLPWEGAAPQSPSFSGSEDSGSPKHQNSTKDRKVIPLKMCFAARNLSMPDLENRWAVPKENIVLTALQTYRYVAILLSPFAYFYAIIWLLTKLYRGKHQSEMNHFCTSIFKLLHTYMYIYRSILDEHTRSLMMVMPGEWNGIRR